MADSNDSPRKTLDEIRSELAAAYPVESEAEDAVIGAVDEDATAVECGPSIEARHHDRRRRYAVAAAVVGISASLVLVAGHALTREPVQHNALASAPDVAAPSAAPAPAVRQPQPAAPTPPPAALVELERQLKALSSDVKALTERLQRWDSRIGGIESRVQGVESSMRRLVDDAAAASATRAAQRTPSVPRPTATALAVPENSPAPKEIPPAEEMQPMRARDVAETAGPEAPTTLRRKLAAEWRTIKQGFAGAGDDFKAAMRELGRKTTKE